MRKYTVQVEGTQEIGGYEVDYCADVRIVYAPAVITGRPESSHPDESEAEVHAVTTHPPGFEDRLNYEQIEDAAWDKFMSDR